MEVALIVLLTALLAAAVAFVPVVLFAKRRPGYSHIRQTISELGETGAPDAKKVAIFAFAPAGHTIWLFVAALAFAVPQLSEGPGLWLFALLGAAYVGAAMFPCDPGAPLWGTWRNNLHNLLAGIGYLGAIAGMIELGRAMEDVPVLQSIAEFSQLMGQATLFGVFLLSFPSPIRGLIQRIVEAVFYGWMLLVAVTLLVN
ncbi:MAG TPA: DUF998 domain-containing protein [Gammaproteobacteria bacterium]